MLAQIEAALENYQPHTLAQHYPQAGVLLALTNECEPSIILTKRANKMSSHSGEVAFPGGKRDIADADIVATALREASEEIALVPANVRILGRLDDKLSLHQIKVTPCVGVVINDRPLHANLEELDCIFQVPLRFFLDDENRCDHLPEYRQHAAFAPCYLFEGHLIWGLTSYILADFLNITLQANIPLKARPKAQPNPLAAK